MVIGLLKSNRNKHRGVIINHASMFYKLCYPFSLNGCAFYQKVQDAMAAELYKALRKD